MVGDHSLLLDRPEGVQALRTLIQQATNQALLSYTRLLEERERLKGESGYWEAWKAFPKIWSDQANRLADTLGWTKAIEAYEKLRKMYGKEGFWKFIYRTTQATGQAAKDATQAALNSVWNGLVAAFGFTRDRINDLIYSIRTLGFKGFMDAWFEAAPEAKAEIQSAIAKVILEADKTKDEWEKWAAENPDLALAHVSYALLQYATQEKAQAAVAGWLEKAVEARAIAKAAEEAKKLDQAGDTVSKVAQAERAAEAAKTAAGLEKAGETTSAAKKGEKAVEAGRTAEAASEAKQAERVGETASGARKAEEAAEHAAEAAAPEAGPGVKRSSGGSREAAYQRFRQRESEFGEKYGYWGGGEDVIIRGVTPASAEDLALLNGKASSVRIARGEELQDMLHSNTWGTVSEATGEVVLIPGAPKITVLEEYGHLLQIRGELPNRPYPLDELDIKLWMLRNRDTLGIGAQDAEAIRQLALREAAKVEGDLDPLLRTRFH